jgi:hypothetical protein
MKSGTHFPCLNEQVNGIINPYNILCTGYFMAESPLDRSRESAVIIYSFSRMK